MRPTPVDGLRPGQIVGKAVIDETGRVLLRQGVDLTLAYIAALKEKGFTSVYVTDPEHDVGVLIEEDLDPVVRARASSTMKEVFDSIGSQLEGLRSASMEDASAALDSDEVRALVSTAGPLTKIHQLVPAILDDVLDHPTLAGLTSIKTESSQLYEHSIDVCVVAIMIGKVLSLPAGRMRQLATGCLLHDIGKAFIEPGLDGDSAIIQHTKLGFELLRKSNDADLLAPFVAYEHHEHQDGSGLPRGLKGSNRVDRKRDVEGPIPTLVGEICAVANMYDNLLSGVGLDKPCAPDEAIQILSEKAGSQLNKEVVTAFRRVVPVYPQGCQVMLLGKPYSGYLAIVSEVRPEKLDRPVVILTQDNQRNTLEHTVVDMLNYPDVRLRCVNF